MEISEDDLKVLLSCICNVCSISEEKDREVIEEAINRCKSRLHQIYDSEDVSGEYFIPYVLSEMGITYSYYEGVKKGYGYKTFLAHVKRTGVLSVMNRTFKEITYSNNKYYVNGKRILFLGLKKLYFSNKKILSNECFVIDRTTIENIRKAVERNSNKDIGGILA